MPAAIASLGEFSLQLLAVELDPALVIGSAANTARASSVRPAPIRPAKPTISPARTSNEQSCRTPGRVMPSTRRTTSPISLSSFG